MRFFQKFLKANSCKISDQNVERTKVVKLFIEIWMREGINYLHAKFQINILKTKKLLELYEFNISSFYDPHYFVTQICILC